MRSPSSQVTSGIFSHFTIFTPKEFISMFFVESQRRKFKFPFRREILLLYLFFRSSVTSAGWWGWTLRQMKGKANLYLQVYISSRGFLYETFFLVFYLAFSFLFSKWLNISDFHEQRIFSFLYLEINIKITNWL